MSSNHSGDIFSQSSMYETEEAGYGMDGYDDQNAHNKPRHEEVEYKLSAFKEYLSAKKYFIMRQFVYESSVSFVKVYCESIGEPMLIYFPSKYTIKPEVGNIPITEIDDFELNESDLLSFYQQEENAENESYNELEIDSLRDLDSFAENQYKIIDIEGKRDHNVRSKIIKYSQQLNKFKNCTTKVKYKFAILNDDTLCVINRHNEVNCYRIKNGKGIVPNIIDEKTESIYRIDQDFYILMDISSFYDKIDQLPKDLLKLYKNFYTIINKAHTKQTALLEHRLKNYNQVSLKMINFYMFQFIFLIY